MRDAEVVKPLRQITLRNPGTVTVQDRIDKQTVIRSWTADRTTPAKQKRFGPFPLIVPQSVTLTPMLSSYGETSLTHIASLMTRPRTKRMEQVVGFSCRAQVDKIANL
jgi:hypothetical protein